MNRFELLEKLFWRQLPQRGKTNSNFNNLAAFSDIPARPGPVRKKREFLMLWSVDAGPR